MGDRVRLVGFEGCVGTCAGAAALASVARDAVLHIHMAAPLDLSALEGTYKWLRVYTRPLPPPGSSSPTWPLPPSPPPWLYVEGADEGSWGAVAHTITSFAPPGKRFWRLRLRGSRLPAEELPPLLRALHGAGVRTWGGGDTRAEVDMYGWDFDLRITDDMPSGGPAVPSDAELQEAYQDYLGEDPDSESSDEDSDYD
ncbi:uncharacterized protein LOC125178810 [Hyalella azteca]|uniref:Uncharacterized protein LOC125178810 n=1 Tax=Hyalella azteca TaxID=294128 RepID=A0A979FTG8_HYAAZ|nr:uncharacterized protein LOC125178810 [Hyalella azteca]